MESTVAPRAELAARPARSNLSKGLARATPHLIIALVVVVGALFAHELGHALVAQFFGARVVLFNVLGVQWFPTLEWMPQFGYGGYVYWFAPVNLTNHRLILMAGSTTTLFMSMLAVAALTTLRPRGLLRTAFAVMALYYLDSALRILPAVGFMPPGWSSRFTRTFSEAYFATIAFGIPSQLYIGAILLLSLLSTLLVVRALRR